MTSFKHLISLRFFRTLAVLACFAGAHISFANEEAAAGHEAKAEENIGIAQPEFDASKSFAPAKPKLAEPAAFAKVSGPVQLKWAAVDTATNYHVQVATDPNFKWILVEDHFVQPTEFTFSTGEAGKTYWWRVAAVKNNNKPTHMKSFFASSSFTVK